MNKTQNIQSLLHTILRTAEETDRQVKLYPNSAGNEAAERTLREVEKGLLSATETMEQTLANIQEVCRKNLETLKAHNKLENFKERCEDSERQISVLSKALNSSKALRQINFCKTALISTRASIAQLKKLAQVKTESGEEKQFRGDEERKWIEGLETTCAKVSSTIDAKLEELQSNKGVDICICFTAENIEESDTFAICAEANTNDLFTYRDFPLHANHSDVGDIPVNWDNNTASAEVHKKFNLPKDPSHAFMNLKMLPFPSVHLRLCSPSKNLETVVFKIVKMTKEGNKFWMAGPNVTKNIGDAVPLSKSDSGFNLGVVTFETNASN